MRHIAVRTGLPGLALIALAACGAAAPGDDAEPVMMQGELGGIVQATIDDAAARTGVARDTIEVESAEAITWSDGSLGCPEPGGMYTMALVPGYRVQLRADSTRLDYHAAARGHFVLCPPGRAQNPGVILESR